jgi:hypothetical protein
MTRQMLERQANLAMHLEPSVAGLRKYRGVFGPVDSRTVRRIAFLVPPGVAEILIKLSYDPFVEDAGRGPDTPGFRKRWEREIQRYRATIGKWGGTEVLQHYERFLEEACDCMGPMRNLLNLAVLDSAGRFRGRWDSACHFDQWVSVGKTCSDPGFAAGPIPSGEWSILLECHAVVTDACTYQLEIGWRTSEGRWYRGELHAHTTHSDGALSPRGLLEAATQAGLDFIAVTDHNTITALDLASREPTVGSAGLPMVIPGLELTTFYGHAVALGVREYVSWHEAKLDGGMSTLASTVHEMGGLFVIAHPFSPGYPVCAGCQWEYENTDMSTVDLMEVWSGPWQRGILWNVPAVRWWEAELAQGRRITGVAARDVHQRQELFKPGTADTCVWARSLTVDAILEGLKSGRVFMTSGPHVRFSLTTAGSPGTYMPGDEAWAPWGESVELSVSVHAEGLAGSALVRIIRGRSGRRAEALFSAEADTSGADLVFTDVPPDRSWYRCELTTAEGHLLAISNPIYVERGDLSS